MADNEIIVTDEGKLVTAINQTGLGEIIKPLVNEIHLFDTFVAGTTHLEDDSVLEGLKVDDKLTLMREENKFDNNAIIIKNEAGRKIGYIPEKDNLIFARLMDAGKMLIAKIKGITKKGTFTQITIGIFLVDF